MHGLRGAGDDAGGDTGAPTIYATQSPVSGTPKFYDLTIEAADANAYTLRATPINAQIGDGIIEITSTNIRRWDENDSGAFEVAEENDWNEG